MKKLFLDELQRIDTPTYQNAAKTPIWVVLDNIRSAHNVGAMFRTADAFRIEGISLCGITATPPNKEILKTALGATETVTWEYVDKIEDSIIRLKEKNYTIAIVEQTDASVFLQEYIYCDQKPIAIVLGNEVNGVSEEAIQLADVALEIPQIGTKHSLNVSVCGGIVLWHFYHKYFNS